VTRKSANVVNIHDYAYLRKIRACRLDKNKDFENAFVDLLETDVYDHLIVPIGTVEGRQVTSTIRDYKTLFLQERPMTLELQKVVRTMLTTWLNTMHMYGLAREEDSYD